MELTEEYVPAGHGTQLCVGSWELDAGVVSTAYVPALHETGNVVV
jgi:hypothetical protein